MNQLRDARADDLPAILEILSQLTVVGDRENSTTRWEAMLANPALETVVVEHHGEVVGCGTLLVEEKLIHSAAAVGHIEDVVIDTAHRHNGLGVSLMAELERRARQRGCYKIILACTPELSWFYETCGLEQYGVCMAKYLCLE